MVEKSFVSEYSPFQPWLTGLLWIPSLGYAADKIRSRPHRRVFDWLSIVYKQVARGNLSQLPLKIWIFEWKVKKILYLLLYRLLICMSRKRTVICTHTVYSLSWKSFPRVTDKLTRVGFLLDQTDQAINTPQVSGFWPVLIILYCIIYVVTVSFRVLAV